MAKRSALAALTALALLALWPSWADTWTSLLRALALPLARGGRLLGPPTASATLAAVVAALVLLPMPPARLARFVAAAVASCLAAELLVVLAGAAFSLPASLLSLLAGVAQDGVPIAWLIGAAMASRASSAE